MTRRTEKPLQVRTVHSGVDDWDGWKRALKILMDRVASDRSPVPIPQGVPQFSVVYRGWSDVNGTSMCRIRIEARRGNVVRICGVLQLDAVELAAIRELAVAS